MQYWVDAQLSPAIARWLAQRFAVQAKHLKDLDLVGASDPQIFSAAREAPDVVVLTKDRDFVELVRRRGTPPQVLWMTCGNTSNGAMFQILEATFEDARRMLEAGESLVEIKG